jgi:predicted SnoaL-like aldol condensation-catalyzing enzyme
MEPLSERQSAGKESSMPSSQLQTVRRFVEEFQSGHDVEVARQLSSNDCTDWTPVAPFSPDRDGVMELFSMLFDAFPDLHVEIHDLIEAGDKVVTRKTFHGPTWATSWASPLPDGPSPGT